MRLARGVLILGLLLSGPAAATQVKIFQAQSQGAFLAGTLDGVSVDTLGRVELAPRVERLAALDEPFLLSAAVHPDGWVVGTGNAGRVLKIDRKGKVSELFAAAEPEVFAVWADADGTVFAGSSPGGKVYRLAPGARAPEVWFEPGETYVWSLARGAGGALLVATGTQGKLFEVAGKGKGRVLYDSEDTHVRSLAVLPGGEVAVGTAGEGLVLVVGKDGRVRTLHDADQPEVVALAATPDGTTYAALVASEASLIDLSKPPGQGEAPKGQGEPTVTVTVVEGGEAAGTGAAGTGGAGAMGSRKEGAGGPRSAVVRISPAGVVERVWDFNDDTIYALLWQGEALWAGTGLEGKLYRWDGTQMLLEKDVDERQVVALLPGEAGPAFATTNAAAFFRTTAGREQRGTYTSAPLDAGQVARFGSFRWRGETPGGGAVRLSFRSGVSAEPDATWSAWTEPREGREIALEGLGLPRGRYVQWRAELRAGSSASPRLYGAELSYRQENLKPRIDGLLALEPGQILVPANFNPSNQVYEPAHPNREGIFSTVELSGAQEDGRTKPLWKKGFRSLRWSASDPNGDQLRYALSFRPEGGDRGEHGWLQVAEDIKEDYYSFDATVLPDGVYRFRLAATDRESNVPEEAQGAEQVSDPVVIDHTPPVLGRVAREGKALRVELTDALSPLREAVYSVDAGEWRPARPADGLIDGQGEVLLLDPGEEQESGLLLLRVTDAAYNVVTFDLTQRR